MNDQRIFNATLMPQADFDKLVKESKLIKESKFRAELARPDRFEMLKSKSLLENENVTITDSFQRKGVPVGCSLQQLSIDSESDDEKQV